MEPAHDWKEMRSGFVKFSTADGAAVMLLPGAQQFCPSALGYGFSSPGQRLQLLSVSK